MVSLRPRRSAVGQFKEVHSGGEEDEGEQSDFAPEAVASKGPSTASSPLSDSVASESEVEEESDPPPKRKRSKKAVESKPYSTPTKRTATKAKKPSTSPGKQAGLGSTQMRAPPALHALSSAHYRRPPPLFLRESPITRLAQEPKPLSGARVVLTRNGHDSPGIAARIAKAWAKCIGRGPVWQLLEDRAWFKECVEHEDLETRPCVYEDLELPDAWQPLTKTAARSYLPQQDKGDGPSEQTVTCSFGHFEEQTKKTLNMFESVDMKQYFPEDNSHVLYTGGPVWTLDWCPVSSAYMKANNNEQYIAIAPLPHKKHTIMHQRSGPACIQIWTLSKTEEGSVGTSCPLVLCVDFGCAIHLKWCPLPSHRDTSRLGLIAAVFEDGSASLFPCPTPPKGSDEPAYVHLTEPLVKIQMEDAHCTTVEWANSELIAVGLSNGSIAIYDIMNVVPGQQSEIQPLHYISSQQSAIRSLAWIRVPPVSVDGQFDTTGDPTVLVSVGYDGALVYTDIADHTTQILNRARDVVNCVAFSPYLVGALSSEADSSVKCTTISPGHLFKGQFIVDPGGPVMSIDASDFHPRIIVGSADGACSITNGLRNLRRASSVPFLVFKIFQLDYSQKEDEYRMLDHFLPREASDKNLAARKATRGEDTQALESSVGAWPPEIAVTCVRWNSGSGMHNAPFLASATASGLCRIDWLPGRFHKDKMPFGSIDAIRGETDQDVVESEELDED